MWDTIKNKLGFNAKTPAPINQSKYTLPTNQVSSSNMSRYTPSNSNLVSLSQNAGNKSGGGGSWTTPTTAVKTAINNSPVGNNNNSWGLLGATADWTKNMTQNTLQGASDVGKAVLGPNHFPSGPGYVSPIKGISGNPADYGFGTNKIDVKGAIDKATGGNNTMNSSNASMIPTTSTGTPTGTSTGGTATPTKEQQIATVQAQIAELTKQRDAQASTEAGATGGKKEETRSERNKRIDAERRAKKQAEKDARNANTNSPTYFEDILNQGKDNIGKTPENIQKFQDIQTQLQQRITDLDNDYAKRISGLNTQGMSLAAKSGEEKGIQENYQAQKNALETAKLENSNQLSAANTLYSTQSGLLQNLASQSAPQSQWGFTASIDPVTGKNRSGQPFGNDPAIQNMVKQAYDIYRTNGDIDDPRIKELFSLFQGGEAVAKSLLMEYAKAGNGGQTPNFAGQSSSAQSGIAQGTGFQEQVWTLRTGLNQLQNAGNQAQNFLKEVKIINPLDSALLNAPINSYIGSMQNSSAMASYEAIMQEVRAFYSAITAANGGVTPSDVSAHMASFETLSANGLPAFLDTLHKLGNNNLSELQNSARQLNPGANIGSPVSVNTNPVIAPNSTQVGGGIQNPYAQGAVGILPALGRTAIGGWVLNNILK